MGLRNNARVRRISPSLCPRKHLIVVTALAFLAPTICQVCLPIEHFKICVCSAHKRPAEVVEAMADMLNRNPSPSLLEKVVGGGRSVRRLKIIGCDIVGDQYCVLGSFV